MFYYWHRLMHILGNFSGHIVTKWHDGELWVGFQCDECGEVTGVHVAPKHTYQ